MTSVQNSIMNGRSSILLVLSMIVGSLAKPPPTFLEYKDSLGQYSFGYSAPGSARSEVRSRDGTTRGSYSYVDVLGNIQSAQYTADGENGFRIVATNLPQAPTPVEDTPEVVAAKIDHFKAFEAASRLAEGKLEDDRMSAIAGGKSADPVTAEVPEKSADGRDIQAPTASAKSPQAIAITGTVQSENTLARENDEADVSARSRNADGLQAAKIGGSMELQNAEPGNSKEASVMISAVKNESASVQISKEAGQDGSSQLSGDVNSAVLPDHSDVPVVTTSFVIPGNLNLHTKIQLDHSGGAAARVAPAEPSAFSAVEPSTSQSQDANLNTSNLSPAGTATIPVADRKNAEILDGTSSLPSASIKPMRRIDAEDHSGSAVHVIGPSNVYGFAYGIGINPIYRQYSPYHYLPYTIL